MNTSYCLDINTPNCFEDQTLGLLALKASHGWEEKSVPGGTNFSVRSGERVILERLAEDARAISSQILTKISEYEDKPWQTAWKEFFTPIPIGERFLILPPWLKDTDSKGATKIIIEPECAFGTGHHASTVLCLKALDLLIAEGGPGSTFLDLGAGSGILGIAAALSGMSGIGLDIDPIATANAIKNLGHNGNPAASQMTGDLDLVSGKKYDLIMANILARPLIDMAGELTACLASGGSMILSGILDRQAPAVTEAYIEQGLKLRSTLADGEWRALMFERS
ncbi:MAG: 50S ribosomal protein L11 methyltransferase [Desulfovibrio sp.]|nr:50S ribosomal protein L11 methyltransferase [Desulfovibrio sp.]